MLIPLLVAGVDCDNGSEFFNCHLLRYFAEHPEKPQFKRSRPYNKNDNALYANEWSLLQNHFCFAMKLIEKKRVGARYRKKYTKPETPYARVAVSGEIDQNTKYS